MFVLHLHGICDIVQAKRDIWRTGQQRDRVGLQFLLIISALVPQYSNCVESSCHVHQFFGDVQAKIECFDAKASL